MEEIQASVSSALISTTRAVSQLANEDLAFHRSLDPGVASLLDRQNARLLDLTERLLGAATANTASVRPTSLRSIENVESNWRAVVDVVDSLLERADTALDEFTGAVKRLSPAATDVEKKSKSTSKLAAQAWRNVELEKPQLRFEHPPTNHETGPFMPLLTTRPHALSNGNEETDSYAHPYRMEIEAYQYPPSIYIQSEPIMYHPFDSTTATFVDTEDALHEMLAELKDAQEIAIDLEHHDQRSYIGIVCLMQISTRNKDWIVDTLKPWRRKLSCLNEVFANPRIIKVLHGAYMDVVWLQRDLGLYLVGLFDTHYAARALGYPGGSLAFLLKKFVNVEAQKQYQMADWRIRPLPQELLDYARSDTHYLLYIFDNMRNELVQKSDFSQPDQEGDKIRDVLTRSVEIALQLYEHPTYDAELGQGSVGWYKLLARSSTNLTKEQFSVFRAVHQWRDNVAREQDDSVHYVMPNHSIFSIARTMPSMKAELLKLVHTQTVRLRADELISVIHKAKSDSKDGPEMVDILSKVEPQDRRRTQQRVEPSHSVAAYLPTAPANGTGASLLSGASNSTLQLRSATSAFWGPAFESSAHQTRPISTASNVALTIPLPPLDPEGFVESGNVPAATGSTGEASQEPVAARDQINASDDDIFVLKQLGKKRKRASEAISADHMAEQGDEVAIPPDEEAERLRLKAERKKAKKEAKRAAKRAELEDAAATASGDPDANEPFDYMAAPSVLRPVRERFDGSRDKPKKEMNPYAKALDAPKGLPRVQKERAGRSMTYSS